MNGKRRERTAGESLRPASGATAGERPRGVVTAGNAAEWGPFGRFRKTALSQISTFTVPPGTSFETPEGLKAEDEETRIAFDSQGGVYPIRESVFQETYEPA